MSALSYREYLDILRGPPKRHKIYRLALAIFLIVIFLTIGSLSSLFVYYQSEIAPEKAASYYIQTVTASLISTMQSTNDVLDTFKVASAKVELVDNLKNSKMSKSGYFIDLADKQKLLSKINLAKVNAAFQKNQLENIQPPLQFKEIGRASCRERV